MRLCRSKKTMWLWEFINFDISDKKRNGYELIHSLPDLQTEWYLMVTLFQKFSSHKLIDVYTTFFEIHDLKKRIRTCG